MLNYRVLWLAASLRLGLCIFLQFSMGIATSGTGLIGKRFGEEEFYFRSIDNLISNGQYNYTLNYLPGYAGRMPGYGIVYGIFKLLFPNDQNLVYNSIILSQIILGTIVLIYLSKIIFLLTKSKVAAYFLAFFYALSPYSIQTDLFLFTESFASSALIISIYYFLNALLYNRLFYYFISGCWLSWVIFLRPFMLPFLGLWALIYMYHNRKNIINKFRQTGYVLTLLALPFVIPDTLWTIRNWSIYHRFIPLQTEYAGIPYSDLFLETRSFVASMGEEPVVWSTHSLIAWLTRPAPPAQARPRQWQLTKQGTYDSLVWLRGQILRASNTALPIHSRTRSEQQAVAALRRYRAAFINEHPFRYYLITPLRLTYYLALPDSGASVFAWPFNELSLWQKLVRLFFTAYHWFWMVVGLLSLLWWPQPPNRTLLIVRLAPIYLIILFVIVIRHVEYRYFFLVYPLTLLSAFHGLLQVRAFLRRKQIFKRLTPQTSPHADTSF